MKNEERMVSLMKMHKHMQARIAGLDPNKLPKGVDVKKLEKAYESLKGYAFVLKKID